MTRTNNNTRLRARRSSSDCVPARRISYCTLISIVSTVALVASAEDSWPTYMHDNARSGVSDTALEVEQLSEPLWVYRSPAPPRTAWSGPPPMDAGHKKARLPATRDFDTALFVTAKSGRAYFGSSVTDSVHCVDTATGETRWRFRTGGPVRFPPSLSNGRVYFGSDDGLVYCADESTGREIWRYAAGEADARLIGNDGNLVTFWPVRTSVAVDDGKVYFAASLVPWVDPYLCSLDAQTGSDDGERLYRVRAVAPRVMDDYAGSPLSPMGAILVSPTRLILMQGRIAPQIFDRETGQHIDAFRPPQDGWLTSMSIWTGGGTYALLTPENHVVTGRGRIWTSGSTLNEFREDQPRDVVARHPSAYAMVIDGAHAFVIVSRHTIDEDGEWVETRSTVACLDRESDTVIWKTETGVLYSLIKVGELLIVGGDEMALALAASDGKELWRQEVDGRATGLAAAEGRLFVSTDVGHIYAY